MFVKSKKFIILSVIFILVILVFYLIYLKQDNNQAINQPIVLKDYYVLNTPDNLIYINNKYNYKLILPANWNMILDDFENLEYPGFYDPIAQEQTTESELVKGMKIAAHIEDVGQENFEEYMDSLYLEFEIISRRSLIIDGLPAIEIATYNLGDSITTYIKKDNLVYQIGAHYDGSQQQKDEYLVLYRDIVDNNFSINNNLYKDIIDSEDKFLGTGDCMTNPEFLALIAKKQNGGMKKLVINNQEFVITPNYENWPNEKFVGFNQDETAICAVGGRYPLEVYDDQLIWYRNLE